MRAKKESSASTVSTVANVVTAFCLVLLTISIIVGGTWTANTVRTLQSTYHPDKISGMIDDLSDTVHTFHSTTKILKSGHEELSILKDLHNLVQSIEDLSVALQQVPSVVQEATHWRTMSVAAVGHLKEMAAAL